MRPEYRVAVSLESSWDSWCKSIPPQDGGGQVGAGWTASRGTNEKREGTSPNLIVTALVSSVVCWQRVFWRPTSLAGKTADWLE